jgi:homocysteine S-methyltransferase
MQADHAKEEFVTSNQQGRLKTFQEVLQSGRPMLFDGATGTELYNRGIFINRCFEEANLVNQDLVSTRHQEYLDAGAQILTTNSWGANRIKLAGYNLREKLGEINTKAVKIARSVAENKAFVAGSVGPLGVRLEPFGPTALEEAQEMFGEQITYLVQAGIDCLALETFYDARELEQAVLAARRFASGVPVIAHLSVDFKGELMTGVPLKKAIQKLDELGVDVIGFNCSVGPQPMLSIIEKIIHITKTPLVAQPNAGLPRQVEGRMIYMCTPEYMAEYTRKFIETGVRIVGGCCGTSPAHIAAMAQTFRHQLAVHHHMSGHVTSSGKEGVNGSAAENGKAQRVPFAQKSQWSSKIAAGIPVTSVELLPPLGVSPHQVLEKAMTAKNAGIDAINIPDGPRASSRMSAIVTAIMMEQKVGIETVLHYTCRDRNLVGMQSDMIGAHAIGLRNLLLVTGDPPKLGSYPNATGVFDVDSIGLVNLVHSLNGGVDIGGRSIGEPTALSIGVGVNPVHKDFAYEMKRFFYKVDAGAEWAITQPVFDVAPLFEFLDHIAQKNIRIPIVVGIWPLVSLRNALFMKNEVPGVEVPDSIISRMEKATSAEDAQKIGIDIAREMWERVQSHVQGIQVSAPFSRIDLALKVMGK